MCNRLILILILLISTAHAQNEKLIWSSANNVSDYIEWLLEDSDWETVRDNLDVFGIHMNALNNRRPIVQELVAFQQRTGIAIGIEAGGLRMHYGQADTCGETAARREINKYGVIFRAGGTVDYLQLDSPIGFMLRSNGGAYTPSEASRELADYIEIVGNQFPDMSIGIIEPIPWYTIDEFPSHPGQNRGDLLEIYDVLLDTLDSRGLSIDFFNADCPYDYALNRGYDGFAKLVRLQEWCQDNDLQYGQIFNSARGGANSNEQFGRETIAYYDTLTAAGADPDILLVMSWYPHPDVALPEDEPWTFTYTLREFMSAAGVLSAQKNDSTLPTGFDLSVFPNPFNSIAKLKIMLPISGEVEVGVYDLKGRKVTTLVKGFYSAGFHDITWDACGFAGGCYLISATVGGREFVRKVVLVR